MKMRSSRRMFLGQMGAAAAFGAGLVPMTRTLASAQDSAPALKIVSPADGDTINDDDITLELSVENFTLDGQKSGRPDEDGVGHIHVMIDGMTMGQLTNFYADTTITLSGVGLEPGLHTIVVDLATNTHMDMMDTAQQIEIDYQPANVRPLPTAKDLGTPGLNLVSPEDGAEVDSVFTVEVEPVNFNPDANLEGKPNVPGYGHYHVFVDTPMGTMDMGSESSPEAMDDSMDGSPEAMDDHMAMMSMAGMVAMPGTNTFDLDLTAWGSGMHTIWIEPVQNDHTMFADFGHIEFTVNVK